MLENNLQQIGLTNKEIKIYLALLKSGTHKASYLADIIEMPKTSILDILNSLVSKCLVSKIKKKNANYFTAYDPTKILEILEKEEVEIKEKRKKINKILPWLKNLQDISSPKPQIDYLEGKRGLIEAFEDTLKVPKKNILVYGSVGAQAFSLPGEFPEYFDNRVKKKISTTCLIPACLPSLAECSINDKKHLRKTYFIPKELELPLEINVYENNSAFMSFEEKFAVIIRSKIIADCLRMVFKLAFEGAEKYDQEIRKNINHKELQKFYKKWKKIRKSGDIPKNLIEK
jgi:sugar-specific transcriptional regulator TrmB